VILALIAEAKAAGLPAERACQVLSLSPRTVQRWKAPATPTAAGEAEPPVMVRSRPYNALTASEAARVIALIQSSKHADSSCRELALALQSGPNPTFVSHVTIWEYERALNCNGPRGRQTFQGRGRTAPDTEWVNGPNELWDWDITCLHTGDPYVFWYLYSLLDHWSRKNVSWRISPHLSSAEVQTLWDHGLIAEGLLDQPTHTWPKSLSDRGAQMRSHSTTSYFRKLGIPQLFSRPRTPNDNPYIESHFATIKTQPAFPGYFVVLVEAEDYFSQFYPWYNDVHPHTRLHMLTPAQVHSGQGPRLLVERAALKTATLAARSVAATHGAQTFTREELIADHLPDVSDYPCYSWAGPENGSAKKATGLD
jgi:transposase InsO family protein